MSDTRIAPPVAPAAVVPIAPVEREAREPTLIEASLSSAQSISDTMTGVIQPQINSHSAAITAAQGQLTTYGQAIASAKTLLETQGGEIGRAQEKLTAHDVAIASAKTLLETQGGEIGKAQEKLTAHDVAIASAKTQLEAHTADITKAQGLITTQGEAIASAKTRLDTQNETLTGVQTHVTNLAETTGRHEQAITFALLGDEGHIRRQGLELAALAERVWRLEHPDGGDEPMPRDAAHDQAREMRVANEALRERVEAMEGAIRQLLEHGPQGSGSRSLR